MTAPNGTWTADFKGQFKTRNGVYCYPLTIVDGYSRYLLACHGLLSTAIAGARPIFLRLFQEYGLPGIIRTEGSDRKIAFEMSPPSAVSSTFQRRQRVRGSC